MVGGGCEGQVLMGLRKEVWPRRSLVFGRMLTGSSREVVGVCDAVCAIPVSAHTRSTTRWTTHDGILELQLLLLSIRARLVLLRLLGSPDSVSLFSQLIL